MGKAAFINMLQSSLMRKPCISMLWISNEIGSNKHFPAGRGDSAEKLRAFWLVANKLLSSCSAPGERKFSTDRLQEIL